MTSFTVPEPAHTAPAGIYYRVTVKDSTTGQEVLRYTQVSFAGATFNFDNYAPLNLGSFAPLTGNSVNGNLNVAGNVAATGTVTGSNIPGNILQQIFSSGVGQTQRTAANFTAGIQCTDNAGTSRTDCRLGTFTTVSFSATPTFDASASSTFKITLTANVTSSTLSGAVAGQPIGLEICQDATGGRTFVPPANVLNFVTIPSAANACIFESFVYDGSNALADQSVGGLLLSQRTAPATAGVARLASGDQVCFRNNANGANVCLTKTGALSSPFPADTLDATGFGGIKALQVFGTGSGGQASSSVIASASGSPGYAINTTNGAADQKWTDCFQDTAKFQCRFVNDANSVVNQFLTVNRGAGAAVGSVVVGAGGLSQTFSASLSGTVVLDTAVQTLTNKTLTTLIVGGGTALTGETGNGTNIATFSMLQGACLGTASAGTTLGLNFGPCTSGVGVNMVVGTSATIKNLFCAANTGGVNASSGAVSVSKNGSAQTLTCTFGTATACNDTTHSFSVVSGDKLVLAFTTQAAETLATVACTIQVQ